MGVGVDYGVGVYWVTFEDLHALLFKIEWPFMQNRGNKLLTELSEWFNRSSLNKSVICIFCKCIQYMYDMYIMGHLYWTEHFIEEIFNLVLNIAGLWVQLGVKFQRYNVRYVVHDRYMVWMACGKKVCQVSLEMPPWMDLWVRDMVYRKPLPFTCSIYGLFRLRKLIWNS